MTAPLDFATLPPEVNSARMYSGAGSGPLLAAASAWHGLAAELRLTATGYNSVLSELTGQAWHGPSSATMTAAVAPYVAWLSTTAAQAEQTAAQAQAAVAAYEAAFAATVPPPVIAANRAQLAVLIATNFFGQNTAGDRGHRSPVPGNVGTGCGGDVRLCRLLGGSQPADLRLPSLSRSPTPPVRRPRPRPSLRLPPPRSAPGRARCHSCRRRCPASCKAWLPRLRQAPE